MKQKEYVINGKSFAVEILSFDGSNAQVRVNGVSYSVQTPAGAQSGGAVSPPPVISTPQAPTTPRPTPAAPKAPPAAAVPSPPSGGSANSIVSPMPGTILKILVEPGQAVNAGDPLLILEAMKMENEIPSPTDGTVKAIHVSKGSEVQTGTPLVDVE